MRALPLLLLTLFWLSGPRSSDTNVVEGAWLEDGLKWTNAPRDINPHLQSAQAEILYFGEDHKFALIHCTVIRQPKQNMTISNGDPRGVYQGEWTGNEHALSVTYRLVEATILPKGQTLPGPIQHGTIKSSHNSLTLEGKSFRRVAGLDQSAGEAVNGVKAASPSASGEGPTAITSELTMP
jgi:hypothetical protein